MNVIEKFYDNGIPRSRIEVTGDIVTGSYQTWHSNGLPMEYTDYSSRDRVYRRWYDDGLLESEHHYEGGFLNGASVMYHLGGNLATKKNYKNGLLDGEYKSYHKGGNLRCLCSYKMDELDGLYREWFKTGNQKRISEHKNGKRNGRYILFSRDGSVKKKAFYIKGRKRMWTNSM